jgi:putative transferase (TIGR04331 family)
MVGRFLITTAEKQTWKIEEPIVFLGDWCKLYKDKDSWEKLNYKTKEYHWDDRDLLYKDYQYLQDLYEKIIIACSYSLNNYHKVNHSHRYWKIIIGPWLFHFIQILFDRWKMIEKVANDNVSDTIVLNGLNEFVVPINFKNFSELYSGDLWNHWVYGEIIKFFGNITTTEVLYNGKKQKISSGQENTKVKGFIKLAIKKYSFLTKNKKYFFYGSSLKKIDQLKLEISLGQLPSLYDVDVNKEINIKINDRALFDINFSKSNKFESFLSRIIPLQIPKYYLEGYSELYNECKKRHWPSNPELIITSSSIITCDIFKFWTADKVENGTKLIVSQHGGHYGVGKWNSSEDHEVSVADVFLSWGWKGKGVYPLSSAKLASKKDKRKSRKKSYILMAIGLAPRYSYWLYSVPMSSQWGGYLDNQINFVELLPDYIREFLKIRLSPTDYNWSQKERWLGRLPFIEFDNLQNTFESSVNNSKIFIGTYNATTFLETLSANIPTIIFWNPLHWEIRKSAEPHFRLLHQVGILHYNPESAASHLKSIWDNIDEWWSQEETQTARLFFINNYAKTSHNWIVEWKNFLESK